MWKPITNQKPTKIIFDTNFFVSIAFESKYLNKLWDLLAAEQAFEYSLIMSDALFNEIKAKLFGDKIKRDLKEYSEIETEGILQKIRKTHLLVNPTTKLTPLQNLADPEDMHLFELALQEKADFILTNDKQVLKQNPFGLTRILTYKQFEDKLLQQN